MPAVVEPHETVAAPDPIRLAGLIAPQVRPAGTVSVSETVPPNWFSDVRVTFVPVDTPTLAADGVEDVIPKSLNWKSAVVEWVREPMVPVMVRV